MNPRMEGGETATMMTATDIDLCQA
jgi:hypothetical protein